MRNVPVPIEKSPIRATTYGTLDMGVVPNWALVTIAMPFPMKKRLAKKTSQRLQRSFGTVIGASRKDKIKQMLFYSILIIRARPVFNTKAGAEVVSAGRSIFLQYKET